MDGTTPTAGWEPRDRLAREAVRRIKARRDFRLHLLAYCAANALMILIWLTVALTAGAWFPGSSSRSQAGAPGWVPTGGPCTDHGLDRSRTRQSRRRSSECGVRGRSSRTTGAAILNRTCRGSDLGCEFDDLRAAQLRSIAARNGIGLG
jgi:hypothetical protein